MGFMSSDKKKHKAHVDCTGKNFMWIVFASCQSKSLQQAPINLQVIPNHSKKMVSFHVSRCFRYVKTVTKNGRFSFRATRSALLEALPCCPRLRSPRPPRLAPRAARRRWSQFASGFFCSPGCFGPSPQFSKWPVKAERTRLLRRGHHLKLKFAFLVGS